LAACTSEIMTRVYTCVLLLHMCAIDLRSGLDQPPGCLAGDHYSVQPLDHLSRSKKLLRPVSTRRARQGNLQHTQQEAATGQQGRWEQAHAGVLRGHVGKQPAAARGLRACLADHTPYQGDGTGATNCAHQLSGSSWLTGWSTPASPLQQGCCCDAPAAAAAIAVVGHCCLSVPELLLPVSVISNSLTGCCTVPP
jgi:hypothetical protein